MNRELMREVADLIELEDRFDMGEWLAAVDPDDSDDTILSSADMPAGALVDGQVNYGGTACKTVGCVAGWTVARTRPDQRIAPYEVPVLARRDLGLSPIQAARLFYPDHNSIWMELAEEHGWDVTESEEHACTCSICGERYGSRLADWTQITAVQAAKVLRRIADGEIEL